MLSLIVADRHLIGVVQQDVGRHEHRIVEEPDAEGFVLTAGPASGAEFVLELGLAAQFTERRHAIEDPRALGVQHPDMALDE